MARIHKNDYGTRFQITIKDQSGTVVDISGASTKTIYFENPGGTVSGKTATFLTDGTDGVMYWDSTTGFINTTGRWKLQGFFEDNDQRNRTEKTFFYVQAILE